MSVEVTERHRRQARAVIELAGTFTEELHPRGSKGTHQGGRFVAKGSGGGTPSYTDHGRSAPRREHARNVLRRVGGIKQGVLGKATRKRRGKATGQTELVRRWNRLDDAGRLRAMKAFHDSGATLPAGWRFLEDGSIATHRSISGLPTARKVRRGRRRRARRAEMAGPSTAERARAEQRGAAMKGGRFPIRNATDLGKAIRAVGRATDASGQHTEAERSKVRRYIIRRARTLGASSQIPSSWAADGSLK